MNTAALPDRMIVREAQSEDDSAIGTLLVEAYMTQYRQKLPEALRSYGPERLRELRDVASKRAQAQVLVAELDGRVVGTVALFPPGASGSEAWLPAAADLRHLATAVELHGHNLSRPLLDAAEDAARRLGAAVVCLHVRRGVDGVARLYQRRGYVRDPSGDIDRLPLIYLEAFVLRL